MRIPFAVLCGVAFALLAFQPAPARMTVADCLLRSGYSRGVPDTPITALEGVEAWGGGNGERVLREGESIGMAFLDDSDGARRTVSFYAYGGNVYVFVFKALNDPARRLPGEPAGVVHGDCLIRVMSTGG
jgi:hypothetical protein